MSDVRSVSSEVEVAVDPDTAFRAFTEEMDWLSQADLDQIMGKALCAWVGWPETAAT